MELPGTTKRLIKPESSAVYGWVAGSCDDLEVRVSSKPYRVNINGRRTSTTTALQFAANIIAAVEEAGGLPPNDESYGQCDEEYVEVLMP